MSNAVVPEFAVSHWQRSKAFYCDVLGFESAYERAEEGFCKILMVGEAQCKDHITIKIFQCFKKARWVANTGKSHQLL